MKKSFILLFLFALSPLSFAANGDGEFRQLLGPNFQPGDASPILAPKKGLDSLHRWNQIAINASGLDHTPVSPGDPRHFGEQLGPARASRAVAIVHIAMFDALDAVVGGYKSYTGVQAPHGAMSSDVAIAQAAHDTLVAMFPSHTPTFDGYLAEDLAAIRNAQQKANGI